MTVYSMIKRQKENSTGQMPRIGSHPNTQLYDALHSFFFCKRSYSVDKFVLLDKILIADFLILVVNFVGMVLITLKISKQVWIFNT
jgi:hypothetical protein